MKPMVLVVEKDPQVREALSRLLSDKGYEVHTASSRSACFDTLDGLSPDLLILDDPCLERTYRLVWLKDADQPDVRVELVDLEPQGIFEQLNGLLRDVA